MPPTRKARLSRDVVTVLFYLPALAIALTVLADVLSVYKLSAVFTYPHAPLGFGGFPLGRKIQFLAMEVAAMGLGLPTFFLCRKVIRFEQATASVLRSYQDIPDEAPPTASRQATGIPISDSEPGSGPSVRDSSQAAAGQIAHTR
jgi:hypothetical protein